jgi:hypothetical protein
MADVEMEALEALLEQIVLEDDIVGVALTQADGTLICGAGEADTVDTTLVDKAPEELEHFERDGLGATAVPNGGVYGVRCQFLVDGKMRLGLSFELGADLDGVKAIGQHAGLETMALFKRVRGTGQK